MELTITIHAPEIGALAEALRSMSPLPLPLPVMAPMPAIGTPAAPAPDTSTRSTAEPTPAAAAAPTSAAPTAPTVPTAAPERKYTKEELARAATGLMDAGRQADLLELLGRFNVLSLMALKPEQYGEFAAGLTEMGAKL